jgi:hypothetical protein
MAELRAVTHITSQHSRMATRDPAKKRAANQCYNKSPKGRAAAQRFLQSPKAQARYQRQMARRAERAAAAKVAREADKAARQARVCPFYLSAAASRAVQQRLRVPLAATAPLLLESGLWITRNGLVLWGGGLGARGCSEAIRQDRLEDPVPAGM